MSRERVYEYRLKNMTLLCSYEYTPAEKQTYTYPGCSAEINVYEVKLAGFDIIDIVDSVVLESIKCLIAVDEEN